MEYVSVCDMYWHAHVFVCWYAHECVLACTCLYGAGMHMSVCWHARVIVCWRALFVC